MEPVGKSEDEIIAEYVMMKVAEKEGMGKEAVPWWLKALGLVGSGSIKNLPLTLGGISALGGGLYYTLDREAQINEKIHKKRMKKLQEQISEVERQKGLEELDVSRFV